MNEEGFEIAYTEFTLWLMPREPLRSTLSAIIRRLAADLDAVEFEPHVTIFCGPSTEEEARATATAIAARFSAIELIAARLDYTDRYTKTLFVQFEEFAVARRMFEAARDGYSCRSDYTFNPHLSLLYKTLPETKQNDALPGSPGSDWRIRFRSSTDHRNGVADRGAGTRPSMAASSARSGLPARSATLGACVGPIGMGSMEGRAIRSSVLARSPAPRSGRLTVLGPDAPRALRPSC